MAKYGTKKLTFILILALLISLMPLAVMADSDGNHAPSLICDGTMYQGIPSSISVLPNMLMYQPANEMKVFIYKGKVSLSTFKNKKDSIKDSLLKTFSTRFNSIDDTKNFSYKPTTTGNITVIAACYYGGNYDNSSSKYVNVKKRSSLDIFSVNSPSGIKNSIKGKTIEVGFRFNKYIQGLSHKVQIVIKRGDTKVKTKEYSLTSKNLYSSKAFSYTPKKTGTYKFTFTSYVGGLKCKSSTYTVKVIASSGIKKITPTIKFAYYDRAESPSSVQIASFSVNGASKMKVYRSKTKSGKYSLVKTASIAKSNAPSVKFSSTYPYYKIKLTSGDYTSKFSSPIKITRLGKVTGVKVSNASGSESYTDGKTYQKKKISWKKLSGATSYMLYYKDGKSKSWFATVDASNVSYVVPAYRLASMGQKTTVYVQAMYESSKLYSYGSYSDGKTLTVTVIE